MNTLQKKKIRSLTPGEMLSGMATGICKEVWAFQIEARVVYKRSYSLELVLCLNLSNASCFSFVPNIPVSVFKPYTVCQNWSLSEKKDWWSWMSSGLCSSRNCHFLFCLLDSSLQEKPSFHVLILFSET